VDKLQCLDLKEGRLALNFQSPYEDVIIDSPAGGIRKEIAPLLALYREGKTNRSNIYRLLCYYKILEGVIGRLRPRLKKAAQEQGIDIPMKKEVVPEHPELRRFDASVIGRPIGELYDKDLQHEYRNAAAHFLLTDGEPLNPSDYAHASQFANIVLLAELCVHIVMDNYQSYLDTYYERGGKDLGAS
jgi:hypothetical protein